MKIAGKFFNRFAAAFMAVIMISGLLPAFSGSVLAASSSYNVIEDSEAFSTAAALEDASVTIQDASVFMLSDAEMTGIGEGYSWKYDPEGTLDGGTVSHGIIYWDDYSSAQKQSDGTYTVNPEEGFSLRWTNAAQSLGGTELDVELTISDVTIEYIGTSSNITDGIPSSQCIVLYDDENYSDFSLCVCAYPISGSVLCYALDCTMTISFYYTGTEKTYAGSYLFYASDVDQPNNFKTYTEWINDGCPDIGDAASLYEYYSEINGSSSYYDEEYTESFTFNGGEKTNNIYLWDDSYLNVNTSTGKISASRIDDNTELSAFEACMAVQSSSMGWSGSNCASALFESYCLAKLYLTKEGQDGEGNDSSGICDLSGALFQVSYSDGTPVGYFITVNGTGYAASTEETSLSYSVEYDGVTYYRASNFRKYLTLAPGTYTITELEAPEGYTLAPDQTVTISSESSQATVTVTDTLDKYPVVLRKSTSDTYSSASGTNNYFISSNNGYSLMYAVYGIYTDEECTEAVTTAEYSSGTSVSEFTTTSYSSDASYKSSAYGSSYVVYLEPGTYYLKETASSDGYLITNSEGGYASKIEVVPAEDGEYQYFYVYEDIDTFKLSLQKTDDSGEDLKEDGITFKLVYEYTNSSGTEVSKILLYATDSSGYIDFNNEDYIISGSPFKDSEGNVIFGAGTITITETSGADGYLANSEDIVINLSLDSDGNLVSDALSENITLDPSGNFEWVNEEMTIDTVLLDDTTQTHFASGEDLSFTDTVTYDNFYTGQSYTLKAWLYDASEESLAKDDSGDYIYAETSFETVSESGSAELEFSFSADSLEGHTLVSYVYVYDEDGTLILYQASSSDADETVYISGVSTEIEDKENGSQVSMADDSVILADTVTYENLPAGTYTFEGRLYDVTTGDFAVDDEGNMITASSSSTFSKSAGSGTKTLTYSFSGESLAGHVLVAYVYIYKNSSVWISETDPENEDQTIYFPSIDTSLTGTDKETTVFKTDETLTLTDTVTLAGLKGSRAYYRLILTLVSKEDGSSVVFTDGGTRSFYEDSSEELTQTVTAEFETKGLNGEYVAYEELYYRYDGEWILVASHKDINDEDQTVEIYSTADLIIYKMDAETGSYLSGAVYELYTSEDEFVCEVQIGQDGASDLIEDLSYGDYYLIETEAADGYFIDGEKIEFAITEEDGGTTVELAVTDTGLSVLPSTGSSGLWPIVFLSLALVLGAVLIIGLKGAKRRDGPEE